MSGMRAGPFRSDAWFVVILLAVVALGGGTARYGAASLLYVRPVAALIAAMALVWGRRIDADVKVPLLLLAGLAGTMLLQLVPLPPAIAAHAAFGDLIAQGDRLVFGRPLWRAASIAPDLTLQSLASLVVPFAALLTITGRTRSGRERVLLTLIAIAAASALLGIAQITTGETLQLYANHSEGAPNGLFSNRNHQAVFLAIALPMIATYLTLTRARQTGWWLAAGSGVAALLLAVIVTTGSRAGLAFGLICFLTAIWIVRRPFLQLMTAQLGLTARTVKVATGIAISLLVLGVALLSRTQAFDRLAGFDPQAEGRLRAFPVLLDFVRQVQPLGTGYGTFDPAYRIVEPGRLLKPTYLNHAHNELLEIGITGGIAGLLLLLGLAAWVLRRLVRVDWKAGARDADSLPRLGGIMVMVLAAASLFDYPLRTPFLMAVFAVGCALLTPAPGRGRSVPSGVARRTAGKAGAEPPKGRA